MSKAKIIEDSATSNQFDEDAIDKKEIPPIPTSTDKLASKINTNFFERTKTTIYMLVGFILILSMGHFYSACLVLLLNMGMFREVTSIRRYYERQNKIPITPILPWYLFGVVNYFIIGKLITYKIPLLMEQHSWLQDVLRYHNFVTFVLIVIGFLMFVLSLEQGFMKYQFRLFGWTCLGLILICLPGGAMIINIYEGLCWFLISALLIICNDIFAYLVGYFFGSHKLISLSPKKTWEGYIGGAMITFVFSLVLSHSISEFNYLLCPKTTLGIVPFHFENCNSPLLKTFAQVNLGSFTLSITKLQMHVLVLALFASIIGPFGGFFASGLKRSIKIKDFANLIPGHGGITDRMDCQLMMGAFTFFYLHNIILEQNVNPVQGCLTSLTTTQKWELLQALQSELTGIKV